MCNVPGKLFVYGQTVPVNRITVIPKYFAKSAIFCKDNVTASYKIKFACIGPQIKCCWPLDSLIYHSVSDPSPRWYQKPFFLIIFQKILIHAHPYKSGL